MKKKIMFRDVYVQLASVEEMNVVPQITLFSFSFKKGTFSYLV